MLIRHTLLYLPAQLLAPLLQFIAAVAWTHWMGAAEYGVLAIAIAAQDLAFFICLGWWSQAMLRYVGDAADEAERRRYDASESMVLVASIPAQAAVTWAAVAATDAPMTASLALSAIVFSITRTFATYIGDRARADGRILLYTISQLFGPGVGLLFAWAALTRWSATADAALWAFALAQAMGVAAAAIPMRVAMRYAGASREVALQALKFGAPLILAGGVTWVSTNGVRLIVERLGTMADVGLLSVGWGLGLRLSSVAAMLFAAAAFPLALKAMREGARKAALGHLALNGAMLFGILAPLATGLFLVAPALVELMVAAPYRAATIAVLPAATLAGAARHWRTHYVDQTFLLFEKTWTLTLVTSVEAAAVTLGCSVGMMRGGVVGAAWGACAGTLAATALSLALATLRNGLIVPSRDILRIAAATAAMAAAVALVPADLRPAGLELAARTCVGAIAYPLALLAVHPPLRRWTFDKLRQVLRRGSTATPAPRPDEDAGERLATPGSIQRD